MYGFDKSTYTGEGCLAYLLPLYSNIAVKFFGKRYVFLKMEQSSIIIHFPYLTITNADGEEHDIVDLYIKLFFDNKGQCFNKGKCGPLLQGNACRQGNT